MATSYHNFDEYVKGEDDWDYNQEFRTIDKLLWKVGNNAARPSNAPDDTVYFAVDTGELLQYDASSGNWVSRLSGGGSASKPEIQDDGSIVENAADVLNFTGADFSVSNPSSGTVDIVLSNSSLSVLTGDGLGGGGNINLGGSKTLELQLEIENNGSALGDGTFYGINYGDMLSPSDDGDGTLTLDAFLNVEDSAADAGDVTTLDFDSNLSVSVTGSTATIDASGGGGGSGGFTQTTVTSDYTASAQESVWVDAGANPVTVTLPPQNQSDQVRVLVIDGTNTVTVEDNASEQIQTKRGPVGSVELKGEELLEVESDGSTWDIVNRIEQTLASGTLGTLPSSGDPLQQTITAVTNDVTTPIAGWAVYPTDGQSLSGDYPFHAEVSQIRDYTNGETDVYFQVVWDTNSPPSNINLSYEIYGDSLGVGGNQSSTVSIQDNGSTVGSADTLDFNNNLSVSLSNQTATIDASGGGSGGLTEGSLVTSADSPFAASADTIYPVDASGGTVEVDLPNSPSDREVVAVHVIIGGSDVTVDGNGANIEGSTTDTLKSVNTVKPYKYYSDAGEWKVYT